MLDRQYVTVIDKIVFEFNDCGHTDKSIHRKSFAPNKVNFKIDMEFNYDRVVRTKKNNFIITMISFLYVEARTFDYVLN